MESEIPVDKVATILVVDDESSNREVIAAQLKHEGYRIMTASSGEDALALIDLELPDLILLDAMMPGISGFDVAEILKTEAQTAIVPIIMLTALGDTDSRLSALSHGVEEFLTKPVSKLELVIRIRNLLKLKRYQDKLQEYSQILEGRVAERTSALESATLKLSEIQNQLLQSEKMAAIGQLAAGVAHEINNPVGFVNSNLGTLKGYLKDILRMLNAYEECRNEEAKSPEIDERLHCLKEELELDYLRDDAPQLIDESLEGLARVVTIVQDLKSFARMDLEPTWGHANLHDCLDTTINIAGNEIKYKAKVVREYGKIPEIECLSSQINQVFLNMLVNAAQAMPEGALGTITVRTRADERSVTVEIADTGSGISPENLSRIFDPFFTTKAVGQGTGLGLSLSYGIVQRHQGRIEVDSEIGRGTTFRIVLPISHAHEEVSSGLASS